MLRLIRTWCLALCLLMPWQAQAAPGSDAPPAVPTRAPDKVLTGTITRADHQSYKRVPFELPAGTARLVVDFDYDSRDRKTTIDLGLDESHGSRGASGGNKKSFNVGTSDATPSYLPGRLDPGTWALRLAIPNIREGVTARWTARLWFLKAGDSARLPAPVTGRGPGWYRGDFHMHSAHSDGSCASQSGRRVPCPLFRTLEAVAARGLDFIALSEHNTTSHLNEMREAQPYYDRMLLIPSQEVTTFFGHFNVFGVTERVDPAGFATPDGLAAAAAAVHAQGGLISINHPTVPSSESCMGCGFTLPGVNFVNFDAIEIMNGGSLARTAWNAETPLPSCWRTATSAGISTSSSRPVPAPCFRRSVAPEAS